MDMGLFCKVIDEIKHWAVRITLDEQGEPLLHPRILDMVEYAKNAGLSVSLLTNATRLDHKTAQSLVQKKLDRIVFSFDAADPQIYESIRHRSQYWPVLRNILNFLKINHENAHPVFVCASMVLQSRNQDHVGAYKRFFQSLPVDTIFISPLLAMSGGSSISHEVDLSVFKKTPPEKWPVCRIPWENLVVCWDGSISPCALDFNESHIIGDANQKSLHDIWNSPQMREFRRALLQRDHEAIYANGPLCESCNYRFDPEADLFKMNQCMDQFIVRQAKTFAPQLRREAEQQSDGSDKMNHLLELIKNLNKSGD
jgi:radical SAM protein with 4Fe4S-binding SPASM domain